MHTWAIYVRGPNRRFDFVTLLGQQILTFRINTKTWSTYSVDAFVQVTMLIVFQKLYF